MESEVTSLTKFENCGLLQKLPSTKIARSLQYDKKKKKLSVVQQHYWAIYLFSNNSR